MTPYPPTKNTKTLPKNYPWNVVLSSRRLLFAQTESDSEVPYQTVIAQWLISHRRDGLVHCLHMESIKHSPQGPKRASFTSVRRAKVAVQQQTDFSWTFSPPSGRTVELQFKSPSVTSRLNTFSSTEYSICFKNTSSLWMYYFLWMYFLYICKCR